MTQKFKIKIKSSQKEKFEQYCYEHDIFYKHYPEPFTELYRVECNRESLQDINHCIEKVENMPGRKTKSRIDI